MEQKPVSRQSVTVNLKNGLHLVPCSKIAQMATAFSCEIRIGNEELQKVADAKAPLDIMTLGAECGTVLFVEATGDQADQAVSALARLFATDLAE